MKKSTRTIDYREVISKFLSVEYTYLAYIDTELKRLRKVNYYDTFKTDGSKRYYLVSDTPGNKVELNIEKIEDDDQLPGMLIAKINEKDKMTEIPLACLVRTKAILDEDKNFQEDASELVFIEDIKEFVFLGSVKEFFNTYMDGRITHDIPYLLDRKYETDIGEIVVMEDGEFHSCGIEIIFTDITGDGEDKSFTVVRKYQIVRIVEPISYFK